VGEAGEVLYLVDETVEGTVHWLQLEELILHSDWRKHVLAIEIVMTRGLPEL
jgi:hypothetical protein